MMSRAHGSGLAAIAGALLLVSACAGAADDTAPGKQPSGTAAAVRPAVASAVQLTGPGQRPALVSRVSLAPTPHHVWGLARVGDTPLIAIPTGVASIGADGTVRPVGSRRDRVRVLTGDGTTLWTSGRPLARQRPGQPVHPDPLGLLRSRDGGRTWSTVSLAGAQEFTVLTGRGDFLMGTTTRNLMFRSFDGGRKWVVMPQKWPSSIEKIAGTIFIANGKRLERLDSLGAEWADVPAAPANPWLIAADGSTMWLVDTDGTVWRSRPHGWTRGPTLGQARGLIADNGRAWVVTSTEFVVLR